jgi:putative ABC transport system permease protein
MSDIFHDLRYAVRTLLRTPAFTAVVVITLALGIGANTAIFSAVNDLLLRPLTFADADRLVLLWESNEERGWDRIHAAPANIEDWRERVSAFEDVAYLSDYTSHVAITGRDEPTRVNVGQVSGNVFSVLGVTPLMGRTFREDETWAASSPVTIISYDAWQRYFGGDASAIGRTIQLDGIAHEVVGILPASFRYEFLDTEFWAPYRWTEARRQSIWWRQAHVTRPVARLAPGVTHEQAAAELAAVARQLQIEHPELNRAMEAGLTPLRRHLVGDTRGPLLLLLGAVGLLQLIACANIANLLLVRSVGRHRELALRTALGAGRRRIIRQLLTESATVAMIGSAMGILLGFGAAQWLTTLRPEELPDWTFRLDWRFAAFAGGLTVASGLLFGLLPAFRASSLHPAATLNEAGRSGTGSRGRMRTSHLLISGEVGVALLLVIGAGLMIRTMGALQRVDSGVDAANVLTFAYTPPSGTYPDGDARARFTEQFVEELGGLPSVEDVGAVRELPFRGGGWTSDFTIDTWPAGKFGIGIGHRETTPGYFRAMGIPIIEGSLPPDRLSAGDRVPVVVNRAFAEQYFPDESPVGRRIAFDRQPSERSYWYPIVGVVGNERHHVTEPPQPEVLAHLRGDTPRTIRIAIKAAVPPLDLTGPIRETLRQMDPDIPMEEVATMEQVAARALATQRFLMLLLGLFGGLALVLACVGVYGVAAQVARSRVREVGIRMALGAGGWTIIRELVLKGAGYVVAGLAIGLVTAYAGANVMQSFLFGVEPVDPITFAVVPALLIAVTMIASWIPARRATRLNPVTVLRTD